jgi:hypothetical protein
MDKNTDKNKTIVVVKLRYSDGLITIKTFPNKQEASRYINNEGDHLLEASYVEDFT